MLLTTGCVKGQDPQAGATEALRALRVVDAAAAGGQGAANGAAAGAAAGPAEPCAPADCEGVERTAKLFVRPGHHGDVDVAAVAALVPAGARFVLALGADFNDDAPLDPAATQFVKALFAAVRPRAAELGVADFSAERLRALTAALGPELPVAIDQIDAAECCALPQDILLLARATGVRLLAHHDAPEVLKPEDVAAVAKAAGRPADEWRFVLRILSTFSGRQVIAGREYIVSL